MFHAHACKTGLVRETDIMQRGRHKWWRSSRHFSQIYTQHVHVAEDLLMQLGMGSDQALFPLHWIVSVPFKEKPSVH